MSYLVPNWPNEPLNWEEKYLAILLSDDNSISSKICMTVDDLINSSEKFPIKFPIDTGRCKSLITSIKKETLDSYINSAYPLIHENALLLFAKFLLYKKKYGSAIERKLYEKMSVVNLIERLLLKRPVMFMGKWDSYILLNGTKGAGKWDNIGKTNEKYPLILKDCLSYDEVKLSVFLSVSSYSYFLNNGHRKNMGVPDDSRLNIQSDGIVIGLIGARFKRVNAMEYQEMVITKTQNISQNGYDNDSESLANVFSTFYGEASLTYDEVKNNMTKYEPGRFTLLPGDIFFDNCVYSKRLALSFDTLLLEANCRAHEKNKFAYVHVVGIGLGVWKISDHQKNIFIQTFIQRIKSLGSKLSAVCDIDFSYMGPGIQCSDYVNGNIIKIKDHPKNGIKIYVSKREPYSKIESGKLLIVSYAWDGNALPGNEYWKGLLGSTGDSSTASATQITELHNAHINKVINVNNLMIVTCYGHISIQDYINKIQKWRKISDKSEFSKCKKSKD